MLAKDLETAVPKLSYLADTVERYCSTGADEMTRLLHETNSTDKDRLCQVAQRLRANGAIDLASLWDYVARLRNIDPEGAALLQRFVMEILPTLG